VRVLKRFLGKVPKGKLKLVLHDREEFMQNLANFDGKDVWITIDRVFRQRTEAENRYYWGVVVKILAEHLGYTKDEMHDALRWEFLRVEHDKGPPTVRSTTSLSTVEFEEYLEEIRFWAWDQFECMIPLPHEVTILDEPVIL